MSPSRYAYPLLLCLAALAGCATNSYESSAPKNLTIRADVDAGGIFSKVARGAKLSVYRIGNPCSLDFLGSVDLEDKPVQIGLEAGHKFYLRFEFAQSGGGRFHTTIPWGTVVTPRPGAQYLAKVHFADGMYEAGVQEVNGRGATVREFERLQGVPCAEGDEMWSGQYRPAPVRRY